jgi:hypothetical protein
MRCRYQLLANDIQMIIYQQSRHRIVNFMSYLSKLTILLLLGQIVFSLSGCSG